MLAVNYSDASAYKRSNKYLQKYTGVFNVT